MIVPRYLEEILFLISHALQKILKIIFQCLHSNPFLRMVSSTDKSQKVGVHMINSLIHWASYSWHPFDTLVENRFLTIWCCFYHKFIFFGTTILFDKWVKHSISLEDAENFVHKYGQAGFPGYISSMNATQIKHQNVSFNETVSQIFKLFSLPWPTIWPISIKDRSIAQQMGTQLDEMTNQLSCTTY